MGMLQSITDFILMRDLPAAKIDRQHATALQVRETRPTSISGSLPGWQSGKPTWPSDNIMVMTRDGYRKTSTAFACINIIADAVAEGTLRVWQDQGSGKREEVEDHPLRQLMQTPHPQYSEAEFLAQVVRIAAIAGFTVIEKIRAHAGNVVQLGIVRPDWVRPILRDNAPPDWEIRIPGDPKSPYTLPSQDAIVFRYMDSPLLDVTGDTPLRAVLREAGILNELTDFVKLLLERGGMPQLVLVVDSPDDTQTIDEKLTDDEREAIRQQFIAKYGGYRNWAGPAIVEGMRVETVQLDLNQLAFKDLRDGLDLSVCQAFRVPAPVVQVMAGLTTSYGKLLEESMTLLQMYTANPLRNRLDGAFTRGLKLEFGLGPGYDLGFDTSTIPALQEDADKAHERARKDFDAGILTWDEARARIGEDPWENDLGRSLKLPFSAIVRPVDAKDEEPAFSGEEEEARANLWMRMMSDASWRDDPYLSSFAGEPRITRDGRTYLNRAALTPEKRAALDTVTAHQKQAIAKLATALEPKMRDFLAGQRERILTAIVGQRSQAQAEDWQRAVLAVRQALEPDAHRLVGEVSTRAIEVIDWMSEDEFLDEVLRHWFELVGQTAFAEASTVVGAEIAWDLSNPYLITLFDQLGYRITLINDTTRQYVEDTVREALIEGTTIEELAERLSTILEPTYRGRAATVARTESMHGYSLASVEAYRESGGVSDVMIADNEAHTEHYKGAADGLSCSERNDLVVALDKAMFHIGSDHPNGSACVIPLVDSLEGEG